MAWQEVDSWLDEYPESVLNLGVGGVLGGASLVMLGLVLLQDVKIDKLKDETATLRQTAATYKLASEKKDKAVAECKETAIKNFEAAEQKRIDAEAAALLSEQRASATEQALEKIGEQYVVLKQTIQGECPAADDPAFLDFLCSGPGGCGGP